MNEKKVLVIDAQGGGVGKQLILLLKKRIPDVFITAVGTNTQATLSMLKAGADEGATGENAVIVACRKARVIVGPVGIAIADSLMGETTPKMAKAVGQSDAVRVLIPFNHCDSLIVGTSQMSVSQLIEQAVEETAALLGARP
ncbi:MAG: DUF3842 family protein [Clostridia bacterium]|nr:DUF3842 family protein [Clostridia bacterium]